MRLVAALVACLILFPLPGGSAEGPPLQARIATLAAGGRQDFEAAVLDELYARRQYRPLWTDRGTQDELLRAVDESTLRGLDPGYYGADRIRELQQDRSAGDSLDLEASRAFVRLAFDYRFGRVPASKLRAADRATKHLRGPDDAAELEAAIEGHQVLRFLESLEPQTPLYARLRDALAEQRKIAAAGGWPSIPAGPSLKPQGRDRRVPLLRRRLAASGDWQGDAGDRSEVYDLSLVEGVERFQRRHGLEADGVIGGHTLAAMNVPVEQRIDQIRATLERCRWYLRDLPERFVMVNAASFRVFLVDQGQVVWRSRIVVGAPYTETPMFRANIEGFVLNPPWNVPDSIVKKELLPNPAKMRKMRIRHVDGAYVQEPGADNSLGRIKFTMPNEHQVYLHDTPSKNLFAKPTRTFSHGCVRVEHPFELAALLLGDPNRDAAALEREATAAGKETKRVRLPQKIPVFVMYWSVTVSPEGGTEFLPDVYGRDQEVLEGLEASRAAS